MFFITVSALEASTYEDALGLSLTFHRIKQTNRLSGIRNTLMMVLRCCSGTYLALKVIILGQNMPISTSNTQNATNCITPPSCSCLASPPASACSILAEAGALLLLLLVLPPPLLRPAAAAGDSSSRIPCSACWRKGCGLLTLFILLLLLRLCMLKGDASASSTSLSPSGSSSVSQAGQQQGQHHHPGHKNDTIRVLMTPSTICATDMQTLILSDIAAGQLGSSARQQMTGMQGVSHEVRHATQGNSWGHASTTTSPGLQ